MSEQPNDNPTDPVSETPPNSVIAPSDSAAEAVTPTDSAAASTPPPPPPPVDEMQTRADRLAGEPAPEITAEEFARLQKLGTLNLDPRGRIRPDLGRPDDPGVSLRRRRAWYAPQGIGLSSLPLYP